MISLSCGHVIPVKEMDAHVGVHDIYTNPDSDGVAENIVVERLHDTNLTCPICNYPLDSLNPRYHESITRIRDLPVIIDQILLLAGQHLAKLCRRLAKQEVSSRLDDRLLRSSLSPSPLAIAENMRIIRDRTKYQEDFQKHITSAKGMSIIRPHPTPPFFFFGTNAPFFRKYLRAPGK